MTTYFQDLFAGSNGASWNSSNWTSIFSATGSSATIQGNKGRENAGTSSGSNNKKGMRYATGTLADAEWIGTFSFTTSNSGSIEIWLRADTSGPDGTGYFLSIGSPGGSITMFKGVSFSYTHLADNVASITTVLNTVYGFRLYTVGTTIKCKIWDTGGSEPGSYSASVTDSSVAAAGYAYIATLNGSGSGVIADFDSVSLTDGTGNSLTFTASCSTSGVFIKPLMTKLPFAGALTGLSGTLTKLKVIVKIFSGSSTATGAFIKVTNKKFIASVTPAGLLLKKIFRTFTASSTATGFFRKATVRTFTASIATTGSFVSTFLGRVFGRPGIARVVINRAAEAIIRIRRT